MSAWARYASIIVGAYALGCVVGAYYLVRWRTGRDVRSLGSGNAGATNAGRLYGRSAFATAFLIDAGKGAIVVVGTRALGVPPLILGLAIVAVVIGHVWPVQLGFRGGKGAATALGVLLVFDVRAAAVLLCVGLLVMAATKRYEIGGFVALALGPVMAAVFGYAAVEIGALAALATIVALAHKIYAARTLGPAKSPLGGWRETHATS